MNLNSTLDISLWRANFWRDFWSKFESARTICSLSSANIDQFLKFFYYLNSLNFSYKTVWFIPLNVNWISLNLSLKWSTLDARRFGGLQVSALRAGVKLLRGEITRHHRGGSESRFLPKRVQTLPFVSVCAL